MNDTEKIGNENKAIPLPSIEFLNECFIYAPDIGALFWKHRPLSHFPTRRGWTAFNSQSPGKRVGTVWKKSRKQGNKIERRRVFRIMVDGKKRRIYVSRVIFKMNAGYEPASHLVIDHIDGDSLNDRFENLRVLTQNQNKIEAYVQGHRKSKLTSTDVEKIRRLRQNGVGAKEVGKIFSIHISTVHRVVTARSWSHIPKPDGSPLEVEVQP